MAGGLFLNIAGERREVNTVHQSPPAEQEQSLCQLTEDRTDLENVSGRQGRHQPSVSHTPSWPSWPVTSPQEAGGRRDRRNRGVLPGEVRPKLCDTIKATSRCALLSSSQQTCQQQNSGWYFLMFLFNNRVEFNEVFLHILLDTLKVLSGFN